MTDDPMNNKDVKKVSPGFLVVTEGLLRLGRPCGAGTDPPEGGVVGWLEKAWSGGLASTCSVLGPTPPPPVLLSESFLAGVGGARSRLQPPSEDPELRGVARGRW